MQSEQEDLIATVLNGSHQGSWATSYTVHHTAERVMLVFGALSGQHKETLRYLISRQTDDAWIEDPQVADLTGAKLALGLPQAIASLKERLASAGVIDRA